MMIAQNTALFSLLSTTYGGNGQTTFCLPNLQARTPMHFGQGPGLSSRDLGEMGGTETVTLAAVQMAAHNHPATCVTANGNQYGPAGNVWATDAGGQNFYGAASGLVPMAPTSLSNAGGSGPHNNLQPSCVINFIIATQGVYPSRN
jgi:microcystin-dependent protein